MTPGIFQSYMGAASISIFSKFVAIASTLSVLFFGALILGKEEFGLFMIALAVVMLVGLLSAGAFSSLILYHGSRYFSDKAKKEAEKMASIEPGTIDLGTIDGDGNIINEDADNIAHKMTGRAILWALIYTFALSGLLIFAASPIAELFNKPGLYFWFVSLAPLIPLEAIRRIISTYHRAKQDIRTSVIFNEVWPNIFKSLFMLAAFLFYKDPIAVSSAMNLALALPLIALIQKEPIRPHIKGDIFKRWDIKYALKNLTTYGLNQQSRGFDLILLGALAPAVAAADYAIASRLGRFLLVGKQGLSQLLAPRLGAFFGDKNKDSAAAEFQMTRLVGVFISVFGALGILMLGHWVTGLFCTTCNNAYPVLVILAAAFVVNTSFGSLEDYMTMGGYAGWNLVLSTLSTVLMVALSFVLIPNLGAIGAAFAVLGAFLARGLMMLLVVQHLDKIMLIRPAQLLTSFIICGVLIAHGLGHIGAFGTFIGILLVLLYSGKTERAIYTKTNLR